MSDKFKVLYEEYPELTAGKFGGFAVGDGWFDIINHLCMMIDNHVSSHNASEQYWPASNSPFVKMEYPVIQQVKEKFGGLRFYMRGGDETIHAYARFAESMSVNICEECGAPGTRRNTGWIRTLCDEHAGEK